MAKKAHTATSLAKHLDMTRPRIGQLADEGVFQRNDDGTYDIDACRVAYIRWLRDDSRRVNKSAAEGQLRDAKTREIELRMAREEGELAPIDEAVAFVQEGIGLVVSRLTGLPARITRDKNDRMRIEAIVDEIRTEVADGFAKLGEAYSRGAPADGADDAAAAEPVGG